MADDLVTQLVTLLENGDHRAALLPVREDMEIGEDDRLITLSTCVSGERNHRYLVIGVLVETALYR